MVSNIYLDESGTHEGSEWTVIGMLFVEEHGQLHSSLLRTKKDISYLNRNPKRKAKYGEFSMKGCRNAKSADVGKGFVDSFIKFDCYFRAIVLDNSIWQGKYFGDPFQSDALKKRRAYKKWCEMVIQREKHKLSEATLHLDELRMVKDYDILEALKERFTYNYKGEKPWIRRFVHAKSWRDELQCLQLADLLCGAVYRKLNNQASEHQGIVIDYLDEKLAGYPGPKKICLGEDSYWRGFHPNTLTKHFPKFSQWHWKPGL